MSNLFMPEDQRNLDDLISNKKPSFVDSGKRVLLYSTEDALFVKKSLDSKPILWKERESLALCYHDGVLYEGNSNGNLYNAFNDEILRYGYIFTSLCEHDGVVYGGATDNRIWEVNTGNLVFDGESDAVLGMASFDGGLYHTAEKRLYKTFSGENHKRLGFQANYLMPFKDSLYYFCDSGVFDAFVETDYFSNAKSSLGVDFDSKNILCGFVWEDKTYFIDQDNYMWDMEKMVDLGDFCDAGRPVYDVAVVPKDLVGGVNW